MSEEDVIRIEFNNCLDNLISSKLRPTATEILVARQPMNLLFEKLIYRINKSQRENEKLIKVISDIYFNCVNDIDYSKGDIIRDLDKLLEDKRLYGNSNNFK